MSDDASDLLFDDAGEWWQLYWKEMPEFIQLDLAPAKTIVVQFKTREALEAFAKLVEQPIRMTTRSIWYPEAEIGRYANKRYIDTLDDESASLDDVASDFDPSEF